MSQARLAPTRKTRSQRIARSVVANDTAEKIDIVVDGEPLSGHLTTAFALDRSCQGGEKKMAVRDLQAPESDDPSIVPAAAPDVRLIAFYLPQFHPIPENDEWWGKGFTEWSNVASARSLFSGHQQPHLPADLGFYDLRLAEARRAQADLARQYGIYGFCYHYYWFAGRRLLERPLAEVLASGEPDFPFCICWANEPWSRRWDGSEHEVLVPQPHELEDDKRAIEDFLPLFKDPRYIRVEGKPLLVIYRGGLLPDPLQLFEFWREQARSAGLPGIHICMAETFGLEEPYQFGCDSAVEFPPHKSCGKLVNAQIEDLPKDYSGNIYDYRDVVLNEIVAAPPAYTRYRCVIPSWDNTPRRGRAGNVFHGSTPELYEMWLREMINYTCRRMVGSQRLVFINAWNEWGEGAHLEPDMWHGRAYLEATRRASFRLSGWRTILGGLGEHASPERLNRAIIDLRPVLAAYETSTAYLSRKLAEIDATRKRNCFRSTPSAPGGHNRDGVCCRGNVDQINQHSSPKSVSVTHRDFLSLKAWAFVPDAALDETTGGYVTLTSECETGVEYKAKITSRSPRPDVQEFHGQGLWSGITARASLEEVPPGTYRLAIDVEDGGKIARCLSGTTIVVVGINEW